MKKEFIHIISLVFITLQTPNIGFSQTAYIPWSKETKLKWDDFKAKPNLDIIGYAQTSYKIEILPKNIVVDEENNIQNTNEIKVEAHFYKNKSWVFKKDDNLLAHEQLHFDIAALFAYKISEEFAKLKRNKTRNFNAYLQVYQEFWKTCGVLQRKYDKETEHGLNWVENLRWIELVGDQLQEKIN